jgi:5-methyltetrahydropteroyltriglutamate--homocysteine methyltransferase
MPRSAFVRDLLDRPEDDRDRREAMDAAVGYVIAVQEAAGIDVVSDGEWRRRSYIGVIAEIMDGFVRETRDGLSWHTVVEPMRPRRPGLLGEEARFLVSRTRRATKVALPSPYLLAQRMWDPERSRAAYPTREAFMRALVPVLRHELFALRDAGVTVAQLDDPHLCLLVDPRVRAGFADPDAEADLCVSLLNEIVDGVDGILTAVHLCRRNKARQGWVGEGGYGPIVPALRKLRVGQYVLEFTIPVAGDFAVLRQLPDDRTIGLGCVDCRGERVEPAEVIAARVRQALRHVDAERLWLNPDCGFAPGSAADIPIDEAYAKLRSEAAAAELLRAEA